MISSPQKIKTNERITSTLAKFKNGNKLFGINKLSAIAIFKLHQAAGMLYEMRLVP